MRELDVSKAGIKIEELLCIGGSVGLRVESRVRTRARDIEGGGEGRREGEGGRHLRDGRHDEGVHAHPGVEDFLLAEAGIHHVDDPVDGEGGLGDVGGDDALARAWGGREGGREG